MDGLARAWVSVSGTRCAGVGGQEEKPSVNGQHNLKSERQTSVHGYGASPTASLLSSDNVQAFHYNDQS